MPDGPCLTLADGTELCIPFYVLVEPIRWRGPDPDPPLIGGIRPELARDVQTLTAISVLTERLGGDMRKQAEAGMARAAEILRQQLPKGMTFGKQRTQR
ncbi:hypothetical protein E2C06_23060 [Dankookia rubra]|uniref:Uncharacterized protein n=1 Tax=Dankookia rubra TaxID=1442381 RepID=A0A4R5QBT9_9PROT|nr:hypothetical protein [Dankookia rubra]TDH60213.1 hypothetical protein E2C06_23060 [Dankookia rubra]